MSVSVEKMEHNLAKLTIEIPAEEVAAAEERAYQKNRSKINIPGFRKGKAPKKMIEHMYGADVFMEDAVNDLLPDAYEAACKESGLEIVSRPEINVTQIGKGQAGRARQVDRRRCRRGREARSEARRIQGAVRGRRSGRSDR